MVIIQGKGVYGALASGTLHFLKRGEISVKRERTEDAKAECARYFQARDKAVLQLEALYQKAVAEIGDVGAQIFDIHKMMLTDDDFNDAIVGVIEGQQTNAEYAVAQTADNFASIFSSMDDSYMKERAADVKDVEKRVLQCLLGQSAEKKSEVGGIICADDLSPSETVQLDKDNILAFVTQRGSVTSHTAILARTMNIPAVIGAGVALSESLDGKRALVDGFTGQVIVEPDEKTYKAFLQKQKQTEEKQALLERLKGTQTVTKTGKKINLYANIGGISDLGAVLANDAEGIGLFRSEFLYLEREDFPSEEEQFAAYKKVLESMAGKKVIIRTLDIGADKKISYFHLDEEENPALGYRAIRICLSQKEVFKTQLRALWRASVFGRLSVMFPMIIAKEELLEIKRIIKEVEAELKEQAVPFREDIEIGIMIETPAAALMSDELAKEVDFFSVGTNDLTQYTLALDRQNEKLEPFYNPHHEAIFQLITMAAENAHKNGIWIGICGELASDIAVTERFLQMGIDELSVSPGMVLQVRDAVRNSAV